MTLDQMPPAWERTILVPLGKLLFEAAGSDIQQALTQAVELVIGFRPGSEQEFRLAVRIAMLNIQSNQSLALAAEDTTTKSQAIRLQSNAMSMIKAADKADARLKELQDARRKRAKAQAAAKTQEAPEPEAQADTAEPANQPEPPKATAAPLDGRTISEFARKNNVSYAQAWGIHAREKKAAEAAAAQT